MMASSSRVVDVRAVDGMSIDVLASRIEEQSELIMLLKRRADDAATTVKTLKQQLTDREIRERVLSKQLSKLQREFDTLSMNHTEIVRFKDEYKEANRALRLENQRLSSLEADAGAVTEAALRELRSRMNARIEDYEVEVRDLKETIAHLQEKVTLHGQRSGQAQGQLRRENQRLSDMVDVQTNQVARLKQERDGLTDQLTVAMGELAEKSRLLSSLERSTARTEESMKKQLDQSLSKQAELTKDLEAISEKLKKHSTSAQVLRARDEVEYYKVQYEELQREHDAYKARSSQLLEQEKRINAKLRALVDC
eukprot:m.7616 g.7616  ORF g.7616 m.7616 type:complete len:310 (-) comp5265_c0_seq1:150-1079(-)